MPLRVSRWRRHDLHSHQFSSETCRIDLAWAPRVDWDLCLVMIGDGGISPARGRNVFRVTRVRYWAEIFHIRAGAGILDAEFLPGHHRRNLSVSEMANSHVAS